MKRRILSMAAVPLAAAAILAIVLAQPVAGDETNQKTYFTFSAPVQLPGARLEAGTYTFRLLDSISSNRNIVLVYNQDESQLLTTVLSVAAQRRDPAEDAMVTFAEASENETPAIQYWFYPGRQIGHEFVYPREQATQIARESGKRVLATDASGDANALRAGDVTEVDPDGNAREYAERQDTSDQMRPAEHAAGAAGQAPEHVDDAAQTAGASRGADTTAGQDVRENQPMRPDDDAAARADMTAREDAPAAAAAADVRDTSDPGTDTAGSAAGTAGTSASARTMDQQPAADTGARASAMGGEEARPVGTSGTAAREAAPQSARPDAPMPARQDAPPDPASASARPDRLPRTAGVEPALLTIAVSSLLGLGALRRRRR